MNDFDGSVQGQEREALDALAERLTASRPLPAPAFRGDLRRRIAGARPAPRGLRLRIATCLVSGTALLLVAAAGVGGSGPLAPAGPAGSDAPRVALNR